MGLCIGIGNNISFSIENITTKYVHKNIDEEQKKKKNTLYLAGGKGNFNTQWG